MNNILQCLNDLAVQKKEEMFMILQKTEAQKSALEEEQVDHMLALTNDKQNHIDRINVIDEQFHDIYQKVSEKGEAASMLLSLDAEAFKLLHARIQEIHGLMEQIKGLEYQNKVLLAEQMQDMKQKIMQLKVQKKGLSAYGKMMNTSQYIDEKN